MSMTAFEPEALRVSGSIDVALGAGFADLAAPKLSELSLLVTCSLLGVTSTTDVTMRELETLCKKDTKDTLDKRKRGLEKLVFRGDGVDEAAFLALVQEDQEIGMFVRVYDTSVAEGGANLAVADAGDAYSFKVASLDRGPATPGADWTYEVTPYEIERSDLNVALVA